MKVNIFFFTIIIKRRKVSLEEALRNKQVEKIFEEERRKVDNYIRYY